MIEVVITDVTRMRGANVCIAGLAGDRAIRLDNPTPNEALISRLSGIRPGDLVEVEWSAAPRVSPPHTEDGTWLPDSLRKIGSVGYAEFRDNLRGRAHQSITGAFGTIYRTGSGGNCAFQPGVGRRSLASLVAKDVSVYLDYGGKVRVSFEDSGRQWQHVALEDLAVRTHPSHCGVCRRSQANILRREFDSEYAILRVGLSRPFETRDHPLACWVQANGIYPLERTRQHFV